MRQLTNFLSPRLSDGSMALLFGLTLIIVIRGGAFLTWNWVGTFWFDAFQAQFPFPWIIAAILALIAAPLGFVTALITWIASAFI